MRKAWCAQSSKEKEGSRATHLCPFSFQWDSTTRCRQSMRVSDCLLTWTTSGWCPSWRGLAICTILLNGSCGVGQGSGSIPARHMSGTDPAGSPQLAMSCRGEPKCWMKKHVCGQGERFFPSNRASRCWGALWVTWISCGRSWRPPPRNTVHCFKQSRACPISSQHGCCCSIALRHEQTTNIEQFARAHDVREWQCLCDILKIPEDFVGNLHKEAATLPLSSGGLGLRSAVRTSVPAHWASWADVLPMIRDRHPVVATTIVNALENDPASPCLGTASRAAQDLDGVEEFEVPQWRALAAGLRPPPREPEEFEPGCQRAGWQHEASSEREFRRSSVLNRMSGRDRALLRSQSGPVAGVSLSSTPSSPLTRIEPALFRVLLQRRLALPLPLSNRTCRCGRPLDAFGHHRAECAVRPRFGSWSAQCQR